MLIIHNSKLIHLPKERRFAFFFGAVLLLLLALAWKPEVILVWRTTHTQSAFIGNRNVPIPFPWVLTHRQSPVKIRTFSTFWPTLKDDDVSAILEETPAAQQAETDDAWISEREARYRVAGYSDIRRESDGSKSVLCSIASIKKTEVAYCRSKSNLTLIYSGSTLELPRAFALLRPE
jgi:hypothetical protein